MLGAWQALVHAPLKVAVIVATWGTLLMGAYLLACRGFGFIYQTAGVGPFLLDRLWYLFLFVVLVMLITSQLATAYSTMIRSDETNFWMGLPVSSRWMLRAKWLESSCYSAWAVLLLLIPLGLAYLAILNKPRWLMGWLVGILLPLIGIATAISTAVLLVWLRWVGRIPIRRELIPIGFVIMCGLLFWLLGGRPEESQQEIWFIALKEILPRMQIATSVWLPSSWMARALDAGLNHRWIEAGIFAGLLWSTACLTFRALDHIAAWLLPGVLRRQSAHLSSRLRRDAAPSTQTQVRAWWMKSPFLACVVKDITLFVRDPVQWSQGLVFFGLMGAYFANIHRVGQMSVEHAWRIGVASLNLACTLLVFGSLAVRFLFPQMSLEGRRLWLVHVVPGGLRWLFYSKLAFYGTLAVFLIPGLLFLSASRLQLSPAIGWWLALVGLMASFSLVGLALGAGACMIDLSSSNPAKIVSSSGGALVLLLTLAYVGAVAWALAIAWTSLASQNPRQVFVVSLGLCVLSLVFGVVPIRGGLRRLERLEL